MRKTLLILGTLLVTILLLLGACVPAPTQAPTPTPPPSAAKFEVISLDITPPEVTAGETVSITAVVKNIGGSEGTYAVILTVDGVTVETKEVAITPGSSKVVAFSLVKDTPGTYEIGIGELTSSLTIKEKLVVKEVELKYDDGIGTGGTSGSGPGWGYSVHFSPPAIPFTIVKVKVFAMLRTGYVLDTTSVEIWDKDFNVLYSGRKPATEFSPNLDWVTIDVPNITVDGDFRVVFFTNGGNLQAGGVGVGYDLNGNKASEVAKADGTIAEWPAPMERTRPRERTNWMIRVVGTAMLPAK